MKRTALYLLCLGIVSLLVTACGGGNAAPTSSASSATPEVTGGAGGLLNSSELGTAAFKVSGALTVEVAAARPEYSFLESVERQRIILTDGSYNLLLILPRTPEPGAHPLEASGREYDEDGVYVAAFSPALADETAIYSLNVSGTLTLDTVGDEISGSFEFSAQNSEGQSLTVSGTFSDVPLVYG